MRSLLLPLLMLVTISGSAQPFAIGNTVITYFDTQRNRDVACEIHYPATSDGDDTPVAQGPFPVLIVGHGFVMTVDAYTYLWQHFAPLGYIVVLPTTEGGFAPVHADFGADLAFLASALQAANSDALSPFFGQVALATALMGHSMGGGAAFLGASGNGSIQTLVTMAPAETDPSAIAAAPTVVVPALVFAASEDCITPIADHAQPLYDALPDAPCKALVNITGGGHCYFGDDSFTCSFGELTCGPNLTIDREEQHDVVTDIADLWLDHYLRGSQPAFTDLLDSLSSSSRFVAQHTCLSTSVPSTTDQALSIWYDASRNAIHIESCTRPVSVQCYDELGRSMHNAAFMGGAVLHLPNAANGIVHLIVREDGRVQSFKVPILH